MTSDVPTQNDDLAAVCRGEDIAKREFVWLTYDEVVDLIKETWGCASIAPQKAHSFACAIEAKLKEKNQ
jgi:hypothetical protein